jgi:spermidine synthase
MSNTTGNKPCLISKNIYFFVIFCTGAFSLVYQVIWQRYLNLLVGSEARSSTLIVAVFLLGLALGYYIFGLLSIKVKNKKQLLKYYGFVELITGVYAVLFSQYFNLLNNSALANMGTFAADLALTFLLIFPPTILMGATIPIMTCVMPDNNSSLNRKHAIIYGLNTVGAFLGVIAGSLYLMNQWGLALPLLIVGGLNILFSFIYIGNNLKGEVIKQDDMPTIKSSYSGLAIYLLAFISGLTSISLEIIWIRLWGLSIGSSYLVFPMVLSIFVLGLGIGSLTVKEISTKKLRYYFVWILGSLAVSFLAVSYLPAWTNQIRVLFDNRIINFYLYHLIIYGVLAFFLLPFLIPMGKLLPTGYALLPKVKEKFGLQCGMLYFFNTFGTFLGAVVLSYFLVEYASMETIFRINIGLLSMLFMYFLIKDNKKSWIFFIILFLLVFNFFGKWDRANHAAGLFMNKEKLPTYFTGLFKVHPSKLDTIFFKDGKNTTVAVTKNPRFDKMPSLAIFVNGKPDSSTIKDYGTTSLLAALPYLYLQETDHLDMNVIGLGTGVTAGLIAKFDGVQSVDAVEISEAVIDALPLFATETLNMHKNPIIHIHALDAFKFFRSTNKKYDVITSEPSNPWVVGIENLYTPYFYNLTKKALKPKGILAQWIHLYDLDDTTFVTILHNIAEHFKYIHVYEVAKNADIVILASDTELASEFSPNKLEDKTITSIFTKLSIKKSADLSFLHKLDTNQIRYIIAHKDKMIHTIDHPTIAHQAVKAFFQGTVVKIENLIEPMMARHLRKSTELTTQLLKDFHTDIDLYKQECRNVDFYHYDNLFCEIIFPHIMAYDFWLSNEAPLMRMGAYQVLRQNQILSQNKEFLASLMSEYTAENPTFMTNDMFNALANEYLSEWLFEDIELFIAQPQSEKIISKQGLDKLRNMSQELKQRVTKEFNFQ